MTAEQSGIRVLSASHGIGWVAQAITLFRLQAARLMFLAVLMQVILGFAQIPLLGIFIVLAVPGLSAGILDAFHATASGRPPSVSGLFRPLASPQAMRLLACGALIFLCGIFVISAVLSGHSNLSDPELLRRIEQGDAEALQMLDLADIRRLLLALLAGVLVSALLGYFTIPLIWFRGAWLGTSLVVGLKAMLLNWKAFLVLGAATAVIVAGLGVAGSLLFGLAGAAGPLSVLVLAALMLLLLAFQVLVFGAQYCAFRDIFGFPESPSGDDEDQLVA